MASSVVSSCHYSIALCFNPFYEGNFFVCLCVLRVFVVSFLIG